MEAILRQLGDIWTQVQPFLWKALPTLLVLAFLNIYLKKLFFEPIGRVLEERRKATEGVRLLADKSVAEARQKAAEYEEAMRKARAEAFQEQETLRRQLREEQAAAVSAVRAKAEAAVAEARAGIAAEKETARRGLDTESEALSELIARSVLSGRSN